jgi:hypothetical protein
MPVRVTIRMHSAVIAKETVRGSQRYRLVVPPGSYVVSSGTASGQTSSITLHAGEILLRNLYPSCK